MKACWMGVDIGLDGAIAAVVDGAPAPVMWEMPTNVIEGGKRNRRVLNTPKIRGIFRQMADQFDVYVMVERAQMRPAMAPSGHKCPICKKDHLFVNQGLQSQAEFVGQFHRIVGILEGLGVAFEDVHPATWKADVFHGRSEKIDARLLASSMFPAIASQMELKKNDGLAEAVLLADYVRRRRTAPF